MYYRQNCWRNAGFVYLNTVLRSFTNLDLLKLAISRLIDSLKKSDLRTGWGPYSNILLWILFMGLHASLDEVEKGLFALEFQRLIRGMKLCSFEQIQTILHQQLWRDWLLDQPLKDAWMTTTLEQCRRSCS